MHTLLFSILALVVAACVAASWFKWVFLPKWVKEGDKLYEETFNGSGGYVVPPVSPVAATFQHWGSRLACWLFVGPVTYIRSPLIDNWQGQIIGFGNHQDERDVIAMLACDSRRPDGSRRRWRFMSAVEQIASRWKRWYFAWTGCVAVKRQEMRKSAMALLAAIDGIVSDENADFFVFPHGRLVPGNTLEQDDVHDGVFKMGVKAQQKSGRKIALVPAYAHYVREPYGLFSLPGLKHLREHVFEVSTNKLEPSGNIWKGKFYGVIIIAGAPIPVDTLPAKSEERIALINNIWRDMQKQVEAMTIKHGRIVNAPMFY